MDMIDDISIKENEKTIKTGECETKQCKREKCSECIKHIKISHVKKSKKYLC